MVSLEQEAEKICKIILKTLYPTGLNRPEPLPGDACNLLQSLDFLEKMRGSQRIIEDPPPSKDDLLVAEVRALVRLGGRRIGRHPNHRHPI
ncbi:MAG: hypothetical protein Q7S44_03670 [bacterium]|nr:hypothetical protein [bacterium]